MRADIDYHYTTAMTKYGIIGVKVRISKGDLFVKTKSPMQKGKQMKQEIMASQE
jgi:ribosomal protein S3